MTTLKSLTAATAAALLASVCSAQAGDRLKRAFGPWECYGLVTVGQDQHANPSKKWSTITHNDALRYALKYGERAFDGTDPPPMVVCRFRTASKLGQRILATCPDNTMQCHVDIRGRMKTYMHTITAVKKVTNNDSNNGGNNLDDVHSFFPLRRR